MARDFDSFREVVDSRSQFYESVDIRTLAVVQESKWHNLHTDVHLQPHVPVDYSQSKEVLGPAAYFRTIIPFTEGFWNIFGDMFGEEYTGHKEPVTFPGIDNQEGDAYWKENIFKPNFRGDKYADNACGILIQSNTEEPLAGKDEFRERLRKLNPPYYDVDDLCRENLGHTSYRWVKPQAQFFAPLYIRVIENKITEAGNFELKIQAHESISDLSVSTWARKNYDIIDRANHASINPQPLEDSFHQFDVDWEIKGNPAAVSTSIFHPICDEIRKTTRLSPSIPMIALETILEMTQDDFATNFDRMLSDPDVASTTKAEFAYDFEAAVTTLFNLSGFSTYSPEWYDHKTHKGSLPDTLAYAQELNTLVVCECTLAERDTKIKGKAEDALSTAQNMEERFDQIDLTSVTTIAACATSTNTVTNSILPDKVEILNGSRLKEMRKQAEQSSDPETFLREWDTFEKRSGIT